MYYFNYVAIQKMDRHGGEHTQTQTDERTKYIRGAMQTDAYDHFWASEMRHAAGDALTISEADTETNTRTNESLYSTTERWRQLTGTRPN
jgi:hypothetical protein